MAANSAEEEGVIVVVVVRLEISEADWNANVPEAAVAVITATSAFENFILYRSIL